jgi:DNA-binding SARP family transcriptional activator
VINLRLQALGTPRVSDRTTDEVLITAGKPLALLALVCIERTATTREDAVSLFWPRSERDRARASVRQALWTLRKHLGSDVIEEADDGRLTVSDEIVLDLDELGEALRDADAQRVADLWQGGPFKGFAIPDAPGWNRWSADLRRKWSDRVASCFEEAAAKRPLADRIEWLDRAIDLRPLRVALHASKIRALNELGRADAARVALSEAEDLLDDGAFEDLEGLAREVTEAARARYEDTHANWLDSTFVGRGAEFGSLIDLWQAVENGVSASVAILGAPGIGKTRLAREFVGALVENEARVIEVRCSSVDRQVDLGVAATVVRQLTSMEGAAGVSGATVELLSSLVPSTSGSLVGARKGPVPVASLSDALADLAAAVAHEGPIVILVDDVQWADATSRDALHRALTLMPRESVLLLETCRTERGDAAALRSIRDQSAAQRMQTIDLAPLDPGDVAQWLINIASFDDEESVEVAAAALHRASRGHPLHLIALLRYLSDSGVIRQVNDHRAFSVERMPPQLDMPMELSGLLRDRVESLAPETRAILTELAKRGVPTDVRTLKASLTLPDPDFTSSVQQLFAADLIEWDGAERVRTTHDLVLDAARVDAEHHIPAWMRVVVAVAAIAVLLVVGTRAASFGVATDGPWDQTTLEVVSLSSIKRYRPTGSNGWRLFDSIPVLPASDGAFVPRGSGEDGSVLGHLRWSDRGPDIAIARPGEAPDVLFDGGGDDGETGLSPDGGALLVSLQDTSREDYVRWLRVLSLATGRFLPPISADVPPHASWASDGLSVATVTHDSSGVAHAVRVSPSGAVLDEVRLPDADVTGIVSCGPAHALVQLQRPRELPAWSRLSWASQELTGLDLPRLGLSCAPHGGHVAYLDQEPARVRLQGLDETSEHAEIELFGGEAYLYVRWYRNDVRVPRTLEAEASRDSVEWGATVQLVSRARDQRGEPVPDLVRWSALDPDVASLSGESAIANRPGRARFVADAAGWLSDTVTIEVTEVVADDLLLADGFADFPDGADWEVIGTPAPQLITVDGEPVLSAPGDANWKDGIRSRVPMDASQGLTAEVQFQLPITERRDRQSILLCLVEAEHETPTTGNLGRGLASYCVMYPQGELDAFDARAVRMSASGAGNVTGYTVPEIDTSDWTSLGLQVRPDGRFSAIVDGVEIGVFPVPEVLPTDRPMNLVVTGRAQDTHLYLRNVTVWRGARY